MRLRLEPPDPALVPFGLRAVKTVATVRGPLHATQRSMQQLAEGRLALLRYDVNRRAFTGQALAEAHENEGLLALLRAAAARAGFKEDEATAAKYETLASYPEPTLGRALWAYYEKNHFPVPGRLNSIPAFATVHDLCHVLSGYGVDGPGEIEVVAFQAAFIERDPLSTLFVAVLQAHLGVRLVAIAPGKKGALDDPAILERMILAAKRGSFVKRDLFDHWDYWPELASDIDDVRARLGVAPPDAIR